MNKYNTLAAVAFIVTFGLGVATGWFLNQPDDSERERRYGDRERTEQRFSPEEIRERFITELNLEESQQEPFFETLYANRRSMQQTMREHREAIENDYQIQYAELMAALGDILDEEQLEKFEENYSRPALMFRRRGNR